MSDDESGQKPKRQPYPWEIGAATRSPAPAPVPAPAPAQTASAPVTMLEFALAYARMGWAVFPIHSIRTDAASRCTCGNPDCGSAGKHPVAHLAPGGFKSATTDEHVIMGWWGPGQPFEWNIGMKTGSGTDLVVLDEDTKATKNGIETRESLEDRYGKLPDTVEAITGSGGYHKFFLYPKDGIPIKSGTDVLGPGLDIRADGGYIVAAPSRHESGRRYEWEASSDPFDGVKLARAPEWMITAIRTKQAPAMGAPMPSEPATISLSAKQVLEIRQALGYLNADDYTVWVNVGMALHSTGAGSQARGIWNEWSMSSDKYDPAVNIKKWGSFKAGGGLSVSSIFAWAMQAGWANPASREAIAFDERPAEALRIDSSPRVHASTPQYLIDQAPGMIGEILRWGLATAFRPQPHLSLQSAFAVASALASRRYRTNKANWPTLWFLNIEKSGSGKEHGKSMVERVLEAAGASRLVAGGGYTSPGALFSTLIDKPSHIAILDEMGKLMGSTQAFGNQYKADAITSLMEAFGRLDDVMRPPNYSMMGLSAEQRKSLGERRVINPAVVLLGMTTPTTFYDNLSRAFIADGFLGRFIVCHSPVGRQAGNFPDSLPVPDAVVDWAKAVKRVPFADPTDAVGGLDCAADQAPARIDMEFSESALRSIAAMNRDMVERANEAERWGLDELFARTVEKSMRLSMLVSLAESADNRLISDSQFEYARDYVVALDEALVESAKWNVADSPFARVKMKCLDAIRSAGSHGLTSRELAKKIAAFAAMRPGEQSEVLQSLQSAGLASLATLTGPSGRGKKRSAWVPLAEEEESENE